MATRSVQKTVGQILQIFESLAPSETAEEWDNVGLLVGDPEWKTPGAVLSIDLTWQAIETASAKGYKLIINHHPCIFPKGRGPSRIAKNSGSTTSALIFEAVRRGIAVIATHTNFDQCALEVVDQVSQGLGVEALGRLIDKPSHSLLKLTTFVPVAHLGRVREAVCQAGAGKIGNYDLCTFSGVGQGTFRGGKSTQPFVGRPLRLELAEEARLETIFPRGLKKPVLQALFASHPYEEVAYDLYPIEQGPSGTGLIRGLGYGFWGDFPRPISFSDLA